MDYLTLGDYEWDESKSQSCARIRGIDFDFAVRAFGDPHRLIVIVASERYAEVRSILYGHIEGRLHVVVFTRRAERIRIISARKANRREIRFHANRTQEDRRL